MQDFETEEQQIEALKRWWKENASSLIIGLAIGGFALGGLNYYKKTEFQHGIEASDMYVSMVAQAESGMADSATADKLIAEYADTPYAALSALLMAKNEVAEGKIDQAALRLKWIAANAKDEIKSVSELRLARLMIDQKKYDEANTLLSSAHPAAFDAMYDELKGDLFVAKGEVDQARIAYDKAIAKSENSSRWLQLKRQNLGPSSFGQVEMSEPAA